MHASYFPYDRQHDTQSTCSKYNDTQSTCTCSKNNDTQSTCSKNNGKDNKFVYDLLIICRYLNLVKNNRIILEQFIENSQVVTIWKVWETYCFCSVSSLYSLSPFFPRTMNLSTADLGNYWTEFHETLWSYRYMFLVGPKVFSFVVKGVKVIFWGVQRGWRLL
jgi:hypothetical protein